MSDIDRKRMRRRRLLLLAICLVLLCVALIFFALTMLPGWLNAPPLSDVQANAGKYDEAVRMIEAGDISGTFTGGGMVALPPEYEELSPARDGQVLVYRENAVTRVLFYLPGFTSYTTWLYMYASDDRPMDLDGECSGVERERRNWYLLHCP